MRVVTIIAAVLLASCAARSECVLVGPRTIAGNFTVDLDGEPDLRPDTWGRSGAAVWPLTFKQVPTGARVRILELSGDVVARFTTKGASQTPTASEYVGFLGAVTTRPESSGSAYADWAADDTLVYVQGDVGANGVARTPFRETFAPDVENAVLGPEHKLYFKVAKYLDETSYLTHIEITFSSVKFQYERECGV